MRELRFHKALYEGTAVDGAIKVYAPYATIEQAEDGDYWVVRVTGQNPARERRVAGELGNYALGTTIRDQGGRK